MFKTFSVLGVVLVFSLVGAAKSFGAPKQPSPTDTNVVNTVDVQVVADYFVFADTVVMSADDSTETVMFTVPAGKELIIEWINFFNETLSAPPGQTVSLSVAYLDSLEFPGAYPSLF